MERGLFTLGKRFHSTSHGKIVMLVIRITTRPVQDEVTEREIRYSSGVTTGSSKGEAMSDTRTFDLSFRPMKTVIWPTIKNQ